jgi:hypothetical protein
MTPWYTLRVPIYFGSLSHVLIIRCLILVTTQELRAPTSANGSEDIQRTILKANSGQEAATNLHSYTYERSINSPQSYEHLRISHGGVDSW